MHLCKCKRQVVVGVNGIYVTTVHGQNLTSIHDDRGFDAGFVNDIVQDKLSLVSLKIVCNDEGPVVH